MSWRSDWWRDVYGPAPDPSVKQPPKVLWQSPGHSNTVTVTFALPGLRRADVSVPYDSWLEGHHLPVGAMLASFLDDMARVPHIDDVPDDGTRPR